MKLKNLKSTHYGAHQTFKLLDVEINLNPVATIRHKNPRHYFPQD